MLNYLKKNLIFLNVLIADYGEVISVDKFKETAWNDINTNDSAFRTVMKRLKDKIKDDDFIVSHKGYGYIIEKVIRYLNKKESILKGEYLSTTSPFLIALNNKKELRYSLNL